MTAAVQPEPAKAKDFHGYQIWREPQGTPRMTLFQAGHMVELKPSGEFLTKVEGFYDLQGNPVPDPV